MAKWKRWSREFLDPDPLGGLQSGFARQFSCKDAFKVYLGGHLVGGLRFTIVEARRILSDLDDWLQRNQFFAWSPHEQPCAGICHHIYIYALTAGTFGYAIRSFTANEHAEGGDGRQESFDLELIGMDADMIGTRRLHHAHILFINALHDHFIIKINQQQRL